MYLLSCDTHVSYTHLIKGKIRDCFNNFGVRFLVAHNTFFAHLVAARLKLRLYNRLHQLIPGGGSLLAVLLEDFRVDHHAGF